MTARRPATERLLALVQETEQRRERSQKIVIRAQELIWLARAAIEKGQQRRAAREAQQAAERDAAAPADAAGDTNA